MKKRKILSACLIAMIFAISALGSSAFFNAEDTAHNVISSGNVTISVVETMLDGTERKDFPAEGITGVMPGAVVSKIVQVRNTGSAEAWIRVRITTTAQSAEQNPLNPDPAVLQLSDRWLDGGDGYYYYRQPVAAGADTEALLQEVQFDPNMGNEYADSTFYITVNAQAVQTANNPIPDGGTVRDVAGWPSGEGGI